MNFKKKVSGSWVDAPYYLKGTDTETITTLPATIYPLAQTATIELKGNTAQSGTPTPENPIMPQGTGERTGNLLDENISSDIDGTHINYNKSAPIILTAGQTYTFSCNMTCNGLYIRSAADDSNLASANNSSTLTYTPQVNVSAYCRVWNSNGVTNLKPMLNTGSQPLPYEPYGYKIPISSASTTTPVYLGEVETTRRIKKLVLTKESDADNIFAYDGLLYVQKSDMLDEAIKPFCNCLVGTTLPMMDAPVNSVKQQRLTSTLIPSSLVFKLDGITNKSAFLSFLSAKNSAGTPVTLWYVLETPQTTTLNEPLMKIGDYADSISGISIPTIAGANTLDVQTALKPSEVTANFNGWHPVSAAHERSGGSWT